MKRFLFIFTGLSGFIAAAMGAVAAHSMQNSFPPEKIDTIIKAAQYQMFHSLALLALSLNNIRFTFSLKLAAILFCAGIILFSGSLYVFVFTQIYSLVYITPLGGLSLMAGWLTVAFYGFRNIKN